VKRWIVIAALLGPIALAGCRDETTPAAPGPGGGSSGQPTAAAQTGSVDAACLVSGSPWQVSKRDLESQIKAAMPGLHVTDVHITGDEGLTITPDLHATFTDNTVTTITVDMSGGLTMVMKQKHAGSAAGQWTLDGKTLTPQGAWTGKINITTTVEINGRSGNSPVEAPTGALGGIPMTFTCASGSLNLTTSASSFVYPFH
jgi:hypothetical protein